MLTKRELEQAINEMENATSTYQNCEKLATFYTIYDHMYAVTPTVSADEEVVGDYGLSDFLQAVKGMRAEKAWGIMDELMVAVQVTNPRLYDSVMRKVVE